MPFYKKGPYRNDDKHAPMYQQELLIVIFVVGSNTYLASTKLRYDA